MSIEKEIFKRTTCKFDTLLPYGFHQQKQYYIYEKLFMDAFQARIIISEKGMVSGFVYDINTDEEYINFRIQQQGGEFVSNVREAYQMILLDIKEHCFETLFFESEQANRITKKIKERYHDKPEFLWEKDRTSAVFRNPVNKKWYGLIMHISKGKLDKESTVDIDVLNLKLDDKLIPELLQRDGFYQAYHMNKKYWLSIVLDNTISDEELLTYIHDSHAYTI